MERLNTFMKHGLLGLVTLIFACGLNLATAQDAKAQNIDINAAFGWQGMILDHHREDGHGPMFNISVGYRFMPWLGVYLEQDLGGLFWDHLDWGEPKYHRHDYSVFSGATLIGLRAFFTISKIELWAKLGLGATYTADSDSDWGDEAWFAFRLGIGATYMFMSNIGIGADFSYTLGAGDDAWVYDDVVNFVSIKLHVSIRF